VLALAANPKELKVVVTSPLEAAWRKSDQGAVYVMVLNLSDQPQKRQGIKLTGFVAGKAMVVNENDRALDIGNTGFIDDFEAFQVHVYKLGGP